jgi:uncharacterized protein (DUF362 family)
VDSGWQLSRRELLKLASLVGASTLVGAAGRRADTPPLPGQAAPLGASRVALIRGEDRGGNIRRALALLEDEIRPRLAGRRVIIKPNFVTVRRQLAATHVEAVRAVLDFLRPIYRQRVVIAESPADGSAEDGYASYGYRKILRSYDVSFQDLDQAGTRTLCVLDGDFSPLPIQVSRLLLEPAAFVISVGPPKTHDCAVATLSLKNVVMGAPVKTSAGSEKRKVHQGAKAINLNLFLLAQHLRPHLSVIDGFVAMEGNGPVGGTPVEARLAIASTDFLAADCAALAVMGIPLARVGYLSHCATARMGESDVGKLAIVGADLAACRLKFKLHERFR